MQQPEVYANLFCGPGHLGIVGNKNGDSSALSVTTSVDRQVSTRAIPYTDMLGIIMVKITN